MVLVRETDGGEELPDIVVCANTEGDGRRSYVERTNIRTFSGSDSIQQRSRCRGVLLVSGCLGEGWYGEDRKDGEDLRGEHRRELERGRVG
jgi:hypothetical protein